jgi:putative transposase
MRPMNRLVYLMRNILGTVPSASKDMVATTVRTIFAQPSADTCRAQLHEVVGILTVDPERRA